MTDPASPPRTAGQGTDAPASGSDRLRDTMDEARGAAAERSREIKDEARRIAGKAADDMSAEAENVKSAGAGRVRDLSNALGRAADDMGRESPSGALIRQAADGLDDVARSLDRQSLGDMVETVAGFGRRNPAVFLGGAMLAGFALSRFATASTPMPRYDDEHDFDRHFDYDRPVSRSAPARSAFTEDTGLSPDRGQRREAEDPAGRTDRPLKLKPSMQTETDGEPPLTAADRPVAGHETPASPVSPGRTEDRT